MVGTILLLLGALVSSVLASPLLPNTSTLALHLSNISTPNVGQLNTSALATTLKGNFKGKCFQQKPPTEPQWIPTNFDDCANTIIELHDALVKTRGSRDLDTPIVFSKDTSLGLELPRTFKRGSCAVLIDISTDKEFELMPPKDVMDAVWTLGTQCVAKPGPRIGGSGILGPKQLVAITVYGVMEPRETLLSTGISSAR